MSSFRLTYFDKCPKCNNALTYTDNSYKGISEKYTRTCYGVNHNFMVSYEKEQISFIGLDFYQDNKRYLVRWYLDMLATYIWGGSSLHPYSIPFFEPDFSDYDKVIKKIKFYMTFS